MVISVDCALRLNCLTTVCAATIVLSGCHRAEDKVDYETIADSPSDQVEELLIEVDDLLARVYAERLPERFPNWIAFHAMLMHGNGGYVQYRRSPDTDGNLQQIFGVLTPSCARENGAFVLRCGTPYPRRSGPYFSQEHHPNQFLAYFSMSGGALDAIVRIDGEQHAIRSVLSSSLLESVPTGELAYTVLAYSHYLEPSRQWANKFDEPMTFAILLERLLGTQEHTCFGTHRMAALARTLSKPELREDEGVGQLWSEIEQQVLREAKTLKREQRVDGGLSVPGLTPGTNERDYQDVYYTGHCLEWLTFLGPELLRDDWVIAAVRRLSNAIDATYVQIYLDLEMVGNESAHFDFDGLSHGVSALRRWRDVVSEEIGSVSPLPKR